MVASGSILTAVATAFLSAGPIVQAFVVDRRLTSSSSAARPFRALNLFGDRADGQSEVRQQLEFKMEPLEETEARRQRISRDLQNQAQFEQFGDSLWELRKEIEELSYQLIDAIHGGKDVTAEEITRQKLRQAESRDPELTYKLALAELDLAQREGRHEDVEGHKAVAAAARSCLPQFNLDGLWVGKYGNSYDLINVTYVGDTLIAEKVTGGNNVPKGAVSFQADLCPLRQTRKKLFDDGEGDDRLQPITLTEKAAQKWGTKKLPRYSGIGQVSDENFMNRQWIDGQLIIIGNEYFSFAWLPIEQQIFFGRPSPELALKLLKDSGVSRVPGEFDAPPSLEADLQVQKDFILRCLESTLDHEDEARGSACGGLWSSDDPDEGCFE